MSLAAPVAAPTVLPLPELNGAERDAFRARVQRELAAGVPVIVDCGPVGYIDSAGLRMIVAIARTAAERGQTVLFAELQPAMRELLAATRIDTVVRCVPTVAEAVQAAGGEEPHGD